MTQTPSQPSQPVIALVANHKQTWATLSLIFLTLVVYLPALRCGFIWDDDHYVTDNQTLHNLHGLKRIWLEPGAVPQYYPLVHTVFWVQYQLFKLNPLSYHLVNIICHILVSLLWWRLLRRLSIPGSWLAAMIFALHPIQVESVVWVTELKNVLSGIFFLLSAIAYLRFAGVGQSIGKPTSNKYRVMWYGFALLCFVAALLSKTVVCTLPAALVLVMWWKRGRFPWRDLAWLISFFVIGIIMGLHTAAMETNHVGARGADWAFSAADRILIAGRALWFYAGKILWPEHLVFFYDYWHIDANQWWQWLFPIGFILTVYALLKNRHLISAKPIVGVLFFAGSLFPALGFINVFPMRYSFVADHFQYLAGMGIIALFTGLFWHLLRQYPLTRTLLSALVLLALAGRTLAYIPVYQNTDTLWEHVIANNNAPWMALNNRGVALKKRGQYQLAQQYYQRAIVIRPHEWNILSNLGILHKELGHYNRAANLIEQASQFMTNPAHAYSTMAQVRELQDNVPQAIELLKKATRLNPGQFEYWLNLGLLQQRQNQQKQAYESLKRALKRNPYDPTVWLALGENQTIASSPEKTIEHYQKAIHYLPDNAVLYDRLALAFKQNHQIDKAIGAWLKAYNKAPDTARYVSNLGAAYLKKKQWGLARIWLQKAHRLASDRPAVIRNLATCLLMAPQSTPQDWKQAQMYLTQLVQMQEHPTIEDQQLLATASEAVGDIPLAIAQLTSLIKQLQAAPQTDPKELEHLKLQLARCKTKLTTSN